MFEVTGVFRGSKVMDYKSGPVQVMAIEIAGMDGLPQVERIYGPVGDVSEYLRMSAPMEGERISVPVRIDSYTDKKGNAKQAVRLRK